MEEFERKDFGKILKNEGLEARRWMKATNSDVCRVYDRNLESLPVTVDIYGVWARVVDYSDEGLSDEDVEVIMDTVSRFLYVERSRIIFTSRKKREGREQHEKGKDETKVEVTENGLRFECELSLYADTGLFLDQTETRAMVMEMAGNQRVLNLFCYTSSFSVYAAAGGAESVTSVDLSNVYSAWSRRNLERNGFLDEAKYEVVTMDAKLFLEKAVEEGKKYDLVIFDPPAFSNSHKADDFDVQKDYMYFLSLINLILSDGGVVVFSENLSGFRLEKKRLERFYKVREITNDVHALNFSKRRRSCRVWVMEKVATMKATKKKEEMSEENIERLTLSEDKQETKPRREGKASPRAFSFEDGERTERAPREDRGWEKKERRGDRDDRRPRYSDDRKPRFSDERRGGRFDRRDDDRRSRYSDDRKPRFSDDRRPSRYSDEKRDFPSRGDRFSDERRGGRFERRDDDRRPRYSEERRYDDRKPRFSDDRRPGRYDDRRGDRFSDERRGGRDFGEKRYSRDGERSYSKYSSDSRTFGGRRDNEGRRDNYKRDSYPPRDRRFSREDRDWDNDTSRFYRGEGRDRDDRRKKSSPKPFGYDSFQENKSREGATAFWLQGQDVMEDKD